jgi:hypothetical protein
MLGIKKKFTLGIETLTLQLKNTCKKYIIYFKKFKNKKQKKTTGKHFSMQCRYHISKDKMIISLLANSFGL